PEETVLIRNGDSVIYQGTIALPAAGAVDIADDTGIVHSVNADSVLGVLYRLDQTSEAFTLSSLQYFDSFGSFYLKCLTPRDAAEPLCDNWQYVVDGQGPATSLDTTLLSGGEDLVLYFGYPHQIIFDSTTITTNGSFTASAQEYNYLDNTWEPLLGVTIGATQPNPADPWNPLVIASGLVDDTGSVSLTLADTGSYNVGIAEDFYFPSYIITVNAAGGRGAGGRGETTPPATFNVLEALTYLSSVQGPDGSFGNSSLYTDWAGMALAAAGDASSTRTNLLTYLTAHSSQSSLLTDNERRAMTLLSLGQNPYAFNGTDYIAAIINEFDGTQFGEEGLVNDDIFALIPLASAGYTVDDTIIVQNIAFILNQQQPDGSWVGGVDMTAAAIQALSPFSSVSGVSAALTQAGAYLQNTQNTDGGWGNISSSSWAGQAMSALGAAWTKNGKTLADYLGSQQAADGAALDETETLTNRIWATSYAIPAALGKSWNVMIQSVPKPTSAPANNPPENNPIDTPKTEAPNTPPTEPIDEDTAVEDVPAPIVITPTTPAPVQTDQPIVAGVEIIRNEPAITETAPPETALIIPPATDTLNVNAKLAASANTTPPTGTENPDQPLPTASLVLGLGAILSFLYFVVSKFWW
ncbi:terpene cyclase/mutase family protein, partial [Candidatus Falkowbacteria bacterium]|nr:terpene cyclase/mutase family protein [Candidatus Falkowbacteria bacterium]